MLDRLTIAASDGCDQFGLWSVRVRVEPTRVIHVSHCRRCHLRRATCAKGSLRLLNDHKLERCGFNSDIIKPLSGYARRKKREPLGPLDATLPLVTNYSADETTGRAERYEARVCAERRTTGFTISSLLTIAPPPWNRCHVTVTLVPTGTRS